MESENNKDKGFQSVSKLLAEFVPVLKNATEDPEKIYSIRSGFRDLDNLIGGFHNSELIILTSNIGTYKTALAVNIAIKGVLNNDKNIAIISSEQSNVQFMQLLFSSVGQINMRQIENGTLNEDIFNRFNEAIVQLKSDKLFFTNTSRISFQDFKNKIYTLALELKHQQKKLNLIIIDENQLLKENSDTNSINGVNNLSDFNLATELKVLAKEIDCPIFALTRTPDKLKYMDSCHFSIYDLKTYMHLIKSANIELDICPEKESEYDNSNNKIVNIVVKKNPRGPTGSLKLVFNQAYYSMYNLAKEPINKEKYKIKTNQFLKACLIKL